VSDEIIGPEQREPPKGLIAELFDRRRLLLFLGVFLVELALFGAGLLTPLPGSVQVALSKETNTLFGGVQSASPGEFVVFVFSHNLVIALSEMVPVLGAFIFLFSVYSTGVAAQVIAITNGYPSQFGVVLFLYPYSFVELSAYAIAVGAGLMLVLSWRRGRMLREFKVFVLEILLVVAVLIAAAAMETVTRFYPSIGLVLWLPTGLALAIMVNASRRRSH
jgi:uncharacterized membrane protein SpoIIM required for sporulation